MGYNAKTTLLYGLELEPEQAKKLHETLLKAAGLDEEDSMDGTLSYLDLDNIVFAGDQTDTRCHLCGGFEDQYPVDTYFVGVEFYASQKEFASIIQKGPTQKVLTDWNKILPYLQSAGISQSQVGFHYLNQIL